MHSNAIFMLRNLADIVPFLGDGFCIFPSTRGLGGFLPLPHLLLSIRNKQNKQKFIKSINSLNY